MTRSFPALALSALVAAAVASAAPAPRPDSASGPLDRRGIFEILCGGAMPREEQLSRHLWEVAGSLADRHWTPPTVRIRVVVRESAD